MDENKRVKKFPYELNSAQIKDIRNALCRMVMALEQYGDSYIGTEGDKYFETLMSYNNELAKLFRKVKKEAEGA